MQVRQVNDPQPARRELDPKPDRQRRLHHLQPPWLPNRQPRSAFDLNLGFAQARPR